MSAPPQTDEPLSDLTWPGRPPLPQADGLVAIIPDQQAPTAWADMVLGPDAGGFVVWAATGAQPDPSLTAASQHRGVAAISLAPAGEDARPLRVASRHAGRLASEPAGRQQPPGVPVTSARTPDTSRERLRVPHLVTRRDAGNVSDAAVWELPDPHAAGRSLGVAPPDPALVEAQRPALLALPTRTRTRQFPAGLSPLASLLTSLSSALSIETVYRHASLFLGPGHEPGGTA